VADDRLTSRAGQLNRAIANTVVFHLRRAVGRGPTKAYSFYRDNVVVVVMQDALTAAEHTLLTSGSKAAVLDLRRELQRAVRDELVAAIESLTGAKVVAFLSDSHVDPDVSAELFVLDRPVVDGSLALAARDGPELP
jgi:uncharacterized protein YbcI